MGSAEGRSPFAGSLRMSLSYKFSPIPGQEEGQGDGRKGFFNTLLRPFSLGPGPQARCSQETSILCAPTRGTL